MSEQKTILVTGASSGNGQATAQLLAQRGHEVFGTSRHPSTAEKTSNVVMVALDVRSDDSVAACVKTVLDQAGHLDVLVNNAGYELGGALEELSLDEAQAQFQTNFFGVVRVIKAALPTMRQQKRGQIVNISSLVGLSPVPFLVGWGLSADRQCMPDTRERVATATACLTRKGVTTAIGVRQQ